MLEMEDMENHLYLIDRDTELGFSPSTNSSSSLDYAHIRDKDVLASWIGKDSKSEFKFFPRLRKHAKEDIHMWSKDSGCRGSTSTFSMEQAKEKFHRIHEILQLNLKCTKYKYVHNLGGASCFTDVVYVTTNNNDVCCFCHKLKWIRITIQGLEWRCSGETDFCDSGGDIIFWQKKILFFFFHVCSKMI